MSKVLVTESSLSGIAAAIRAKNGTQNTYKPGQMAAAIQAIPTGTTPTGTVNITQNGTVDVTNYASADVAVPNSYAAADEGKVVSNGALVAQTARASEITANGTYDTTINDEVTVNVSGGGGGIQPDLTYLPNSTAANVIDSQDYTSYTDGDYVWGKAVIHRPLNSSEQPSKQSDSVRKPIPLSMCISMESPNHDCTAYSVLKVYSTASGNLGVIQVPYSLNSSNDPNFFVSGYTLNTSVWGSDTSEGISLENYHILALSINATTKKVRFYVDGVFKREKGFSNSGRNVFFGSNNYVGSPSNMDFQYIGLVNECEADATIIANMQTIASKLGVTL